LPILRFARTEAHLVIQGLRSLIGSLFDKRAPRAQLYPEEEEDDDELDDEGLEEDDEDLV
jgi:hypothetical protein